MRSRLCRRSNTGDLRWRAAGVCLAACLPVLLAACGRKGPPLPPLSRVPDAVSEIQARRVGDDVYVRLLVPAQNVDASRPADLARVDVLAVTSDRPLSPEAFVKVAERIASVPVARVDPTGGDAPAPDAAAVAAGARQGTSITIQERLDAGKLTPVAVPAPAPEPAALSSEAASKAEPDTGEAALPAGARRYYMAVAYSTRTRSVTRGAQASVPAGLPPAPPGRLTVSHTQDSINLSWDASEGASSYNVYREEPPETEAIAPPPLWEVVPPAPVNGAPLTAPDFEEPVEFGRERCYRVRSVRAEEGSVAEGPPSARVCRTPEDTFPPGAPADLTAAAAGEGIALRWAPNTEPDLAGYLILRGRPGDATLLPITPVPIARTQFVDRDVMPGVRYVYAVVAIDTRMPDPNRSAESERDEATAP